jgi:thiamine-phosphate pyrophosphorylase
VTDGQQFHSEWRYHLVLERIRFAIDAGIDWVHIREKTFSTSPLLALARDAVALARASARDARIFINDRLDIAVSCRAEGVHLGGESLPVDAVTRWRQMRKETPDLRVGVSCHSIENVKHAERSRADYVLFGPIFETPSKRIFGAPQGIARLADVCRNVNIPVLAIGGINEGNASECLVAGAAGVAAISLFEESRDPIALADFVSRLRAHR